MHPKNSSTLHSSTSLKQAQRGDRRRRNQPGASRASSGLHARRLGRKAVDGANTSAQPGSAIRTKNLTAHDHPPIGSTGLALHDAKRFFRDSLQALARLSPKFFNTMKIDHNQSSELVKVDLPTVLQYPLRQYLGALSVPWLERRVASALAWADELLRSVSRDRLRIRVWDALRTRACQQYIWDRYAGELRNNEPWLSEEVVQLNVGKFVSHPAGVFRHGTGGAVDVTLQFDGMEVYLGTAFDQFVEAAASDYFRDRKPVNDLEWVAHLGRKLLRRAMELADFVVLPQEWWHFELGTKMWADERNTVPFLNSILEPPTDALYPAQLQRVSKTLPTMATGVAPAFGTGPQRDAALTGKSPAFYYGRSATKSRTELESMLRRP